MMPIVSYKGSDCVSVVRHLALDARGGGKRVLWKRSQRQPHNQDFHPMLCTFDAPSNARVQQVLGMSEKGTASGTSMGAFSFVWRIHLLQNIEPSVTDVGILMPSTDTKKTRVFGAGLPRTGTDSLHKALNILGFGPTYHMYELLKQGRPEKAKEWRVALEQINSAEIKGTEPVDVDFDRLLQGFHSGVDSPGTSI